MYVPYVLLIHSGRKLAADEKGSFYFAYGAHVVFIKKVFRGVGPFVRFSEAPLAFLLQQCTMSIASESTQYECFLRLRALQIVVAMSVLEGVGAQLCPDADVLRVSMPYSLMAAKFLALARTGKN